MVRPLSTLRGSGAVREGPPPRAQGSVIVFVTTPEARRYAFIGDLAWQREGITARDEKPWVWRMATDSDESAVRDGLLKMSALSTRFPEMSIVPVHDARAFAELPSLPARF